MLCRERREISLTFLLVSCHVVTGRILDLWILRQTGMKSPLNWHNQPGKKYRTFRKSRIHWDGSNIQKWELGFGGLKGASFCLVMEPHAQRKLSRRIYGCNMVVGSYVQTLALCVCEEGEGVQPFYWQEIKCPASLLKNSSWEYSDVFFWTAGVTDWQGCALRKIQGALWAP